MRVSMTIIDVTGKMVRETTTRKRRPGDKKHNNSVGSLELVESANVYISIEVYEGHPNLDGLAPSVMEEHPFECIRYYVEQPDGWIASSDSRDWEIDLWGEYHEIAPHALAKFSERPDDSLVSIARYLGRIPEFTDTFSALADRWENHVENATVPGGELTDEQYARLVEDAERTASREWSPGE